MKDPNQDFLSPAMKAGLSAVDEQMNRSGFQKLSDKITAAERTLQEKYGADWDLLQKMKREGTLADDSILLRKLRCGIESWVAFDKFQQLKDDLLKSPKTS